MSAVSISIMYFLHMLDFGVANVIVTLLFQVSTAWGIGLIIGPALGGFLAQVVDHI